MMTLRGFAMRFLSRNSVGFDLANGLMPRSYSMIPKSGNRFSDKIMLRLK
jgi:hypothetical protein